MSKHTPLMFLGTASGVGKSLLAAALCRIARKHGIKAAPFKAQNMSLNSFVTLDGCEIGRAQALQAHACGLEPEARFNPVLLKPLGGHLSQVIVMGKPCCNMSWRSYKAKFTEMERHILAAWESLQKDFEWIILEGAGSPAEINLRKEDLANMHLAHLTGAQCLLIADIDKGGAFAALAGTMLLLSRQDRQRIRGFVLNRFRGDPTLLDSAMQSVSRKTRRPFFGVVPMLDGLYLPEEDSAGLPLAQKSPCSGQAYGNGLEITVINWPGASNMTDIEPLLANGATLRLARNSEDFGRPDLVILPGSRNVTASLAWLRQKGLESALLNWIQNRPAHLLGICGGLEILGQEILDPYAQEGGSAKGLGLLPMTCELMPEKMLRRECAHALEFLGIGSQTINGYEIHHGILSQTGKMEAVFKNEDGKICGWGKKTKASGAIWGTWLHGLFDNDNFRCAYLKKLAGDCGKIWQPTAPKDVDSELDRLALAVEAHLDMDAIFKLSGF